MTDPGDYLAPLRKAWWKILLLSLVAGAASYAIVRQLPNVYVATAVVGPPSDDAKQNTGLGALASLGVVVGGPTRVEDLESLFRSGDLAVRVFRKHDLWGEVLGDRYDRARGIVKASRLARLLDADAKEKSPGDWDAIRIAAAALKVSVRKKSGTVSLSFESSSPEAAADVVRFYLEEGRSRIQEEALERSSKNRKFIQEQISATFDPLTRDRLYAIYGQEVEREMQARNREQFGFKVIDSARVPDRKIRPARGRIAAGVTLFSMVFLSLLFMRGGGGRRTAPR